MTTSFPEEPADEIRAALEQLETDFDRTVKKLKEGRAKLVAEGWLFETSFHVTFSTATAARGARELLAAVTPEPQIRRAMPEAAILRGRVRR